MRLVEKFCSVPLFQRKLYNIGMKSSLCLPVKIVCVCTALLFGLAIVCPVQAVERKATLLAPRIASTSGVATQSAVSSSSANLIEQVNIEQERQASLDITHVSTVKSPLAAYLDNNPIAKTTPWNFIQVALRRAVDQGIPANILVLLLMFPVIASIITFFRHIIGLQGFGVYTPSVLAVAFVSTGMVKGLLLFFLVFIAAILGRTFINKLKLQYLPRTALLLWFVSLMIFGLLLLLPYIPNFTVVNIASMGIFPILVIILLSENFLEAQFSGNFMKAVELTFETVLLAVISQHQINKSVAIQIFPSTIKRPCHAIIRGADPGDRGYISKGWVLG